jgi:WD40 repeat protein
VAIRFGPTGRTAAALSANGRVAAWEIPSGREAWPAVLLPGPLRAAAFSTDLTVAVTVDLGGKVQAWEGLEPAAPRPVLEHCLTVGPSGVAVTARAGLGAAIGNVRAGAGFRGLTEAGKPEAAEISPDGRRVALAEADGTVRLCAADQTGPERLLRHPDRIRGMAFSPRGDRLFTLCQDGAARLWDVQSGELAVPPIRHFNGPYAFVQGGFSDRGELLLRAITGDVEIRAAAPPYAPVARVNPAAETARFVSGTRRFLTGTSDGFLALWDPAQASGELDTKERPNNLDAPMLPKGPHGDLVLAVTSSSDGRLAATGSADSYARLWDLRIGALLIPGLPHEDPVVQVEFSADARRLATGTDQGEVRLWDVRTGQPLTLPERCGEKATLLRFSNDGRMLLVVTEGRRLYRIPI